uniref:Lipopolysaccharide-binding protein n=1 Tax=Parascaris univalens TaxID=6257 RepID=A0A915CIL9_PARUN
MKRNSVVIILLLLHLARCRLAPDDLISPLLKTNTDPRNAGMYMRLMPTGLAYLREIGMKVVNDEILRIQLPTITESVDAGQVSIFDAIVTKYWAPPEYGLELTPPSMFSWSMAKMHIRASGDFEASFSNPLLLPTVPIQGQFETLLGHIALTIAVKMGRTSTGTPLVQSTYCHAEVGYVDLNVKNTGVITDFFINSFKTFIIANFKPMVEERMCNMIKKVIDRDVNNILSAMPLQIRINENSIDVIGETFGVPRMRRLSRFGNMNAKNITLLNFVQHLRQRNLLLDYRLIRDPIIAYGAIDMLTSGEISWNGYGGTPFNAPNVRIPPPQGVHMVEFYGTDYIANSLLYHAFKQKFMDIDVGPESSPQLKNLLVSSCETSFCIGEFLGALSEQYPQREVEIHFSARKAPVLVFVDSRARFRLHGNMNIFVRPRNASQTKIMIIRSETTMTSNIRLWINGTRIVGSASIENLDFKLIESKIRDVDQVSFGDLGLFGAEFLEQLLTEILQIGIAIPTMKGIVLRSPKLTLHDRYLRVQTFFKLDEVFAGRLVEGAIRRTLVNFG